MKITHISIITRKENHANRNGLAGVSLFFFLVIACSAISAQSFSYGIDPSRDSIHIEQYRAHLDSIRQYRPTVALVLSGGGAKGAAEISVLKYIDSIGLPVDVVLGTSIGGLLGGLYACGYSGEQLEKIICSQDWNVLMRDLHPRRYYSMAQKDYDRRYQFSIQFGTYRWNKHDSKSSNNQQTLAIKTRRGIISDGIVHGRNVENLFSSLLVGFEEERDFVTLPIPFACIATDMVSAKPKVWMSGSLVKAMRSTMAIPGLFTPVKLDGMVLLDGGMRSNMPAELARQMGADIIITVDITSPSLGADQMNNLIDLVMQATDVLGRESYDAAKQITDIYIQPDVSGYSMLSFDHASIDSLIERGKNEMHRHADELAEVQQYVGHRDLAKHHTSPYGPGRIIDIKRTPLIVDTILFYGIDKKELKLVEQKVHLSKVLVRQNIENAVSTLMGTKAFEKVTYRIYGDTVPYTLIFYCQRAPANLFGASARFDSRDYASLMFHLGLNNNRLTGNQLDMELRLGLNSQATAAYAYRTGKGVDFCSKLSFQAVRNGGFRVEPYDFRIDFNRGSAMAYISISPIRRINMQAGTSIDYFYRSNMLVDYGLTVLSFDTIHKSNIFPSFYVKISGDSYNHAYFPTHGLRFAASYNWYAPGMLHDTPSFHAWCISFQSAGTNGRFTLQPFFDARYVSATVAPYVNMLTVSPANINLDQQIPFYGINTPVSCMRSLSTAGLHFRTNVTGPHYVTLTTQLLHESDKPEDFFSASKSETHAGIALAYAYNSLLGPIQADIRWSTISHSLGFFFGMGLDF